MHFCHSWLPWGKELSIFQLCFSPVLFSRNVDILEVMQIFPLILSFIVASHTSFVFYSIIEVEALGAIRNIAKKGEHHKTWVIISDCLCEF